MTASTPTRSAPAQSVTTPKTPRGRKQATPPPVVEPTRELESSEVDQTAQPDPLKADTRPTSAKPPRVTKTDAVIAMLRRPDGATLDQIIEATGWQRHSARGALAGTIKKKLGAAVVSEVFEAGRRYRAPQAPA